MADFLRLLAGHITRRTYAVGVMLLISSCGQASGQNYPPYRYRLTVEVDTPSGLRTGSSVIEVRTFVAGKNAIPSPGQVFHRVTGEAVAVDLPGNQRLFALLRSEESYDWASGVLAAQTEPITVKETLRMRKEGKDPFDERMRRTLTLTGVHVLPRWQRPSKVKAQNMHRISGYPILARFRDIRDPKTVGLVDPDNLDVSFGQGVSLRRITVERTQAAVTKSIDRKLPSFGPETGFSTWLKKLPFSDERRQIVDSFRRR